MKITPTLLTILFSTSVSFAFTTIADYNSVTGTNVRLDQPPTNATGTGFADGSVWNGGGTSLVVVAAGDLSAPAGTNYDRPQSTGAGPRKVELRLSTTTPYSGLNTNRAVGRDLPSTVDSGEAWISFLINVPTGTDGSLSAVSFNTPDNFFGLGDRMTIGGGANGTLYFAPFGLQSGTIFTANNVVTADSNNLILARLDFDSNRVDVWANPDVANLGAANISNNMPVSVSSGLFRLTVGGNNNAELDNLLFSNDPDAYFQVTGIPEPSTLAIIFGGLTLGVIAMRRRR